ncbi:hypothetical protein [Dysgonomonas macrotermitis]|uniref:Uncharacterized protein n=1 Tax=Dysgonomonas macrotermitis TaxID=1346286 RepID=A0A1M4WC68_9BACT|nr:hypothetical protein [Dysgonomonas macrotermitis]SHE78881.1 hypothetical protein SAMN05444362_102190 [Dysgonomonas macrotermitis]
MAIPKKGSRKITIDNNIFVWKIKKHPSHNERHDVDYLIPIQHIDGGQILLVRLGYCRSGYSLSPIQEITPSIIKRCIKEATIKGWHFDKKAAPLVLDLAYLLRDEAISLTKQFFDEIINNSRNESANKIVSNADSLMQAGEFEIALEMVIDNLAEYQIELPEVTINIADRALTIYGNHKYKSVLREILKNYKNDRTR